MDQAAENERGAILWRVSRAVAAVIAVPVGAVVGLCSLYVRSHLSADAWRSPRWSRGAVGWEPIDAIMAIFLGALLAPRLVWLAVDLVARYTGRTLPETFLQGEDFWAVVVPGTVLAYFIYVANVGDASFWPTAFALLAVGIFRHGFRKSRAIRQGALEAGRLTMK